MWGDNSNLWITDSPGTGLRTKSRDTSKGEAGDHHGIWVSADPAGGSAAFARDFEL
jgi:hypothetical protein